jgi:protein TonB
MPERWLPQRQLRPVRLRRRMALPARAGREGTVHFTVRVSKRGRVKRCTIDQSSGHADLDRRACSIMKNRARFTPAKDDRGRPVEDSVSSRVRWMLVP